jgi:hypothetical protein
MKRYRIQSQCNWAVLGLALCLLSQSAYSMGRSSEETRQLQSVGETIKANLETINTLRAELEMPLENAPQISKNPTLEQLSAIVVQQSNEINQLQAKYEAAKKASMEDAQKDAATAIALKKNVNIEPSQWQESRCKGLGDSIPNTQVAGRKSWSTSCFDKYADKMLDESNEYTRTHGGIINSHLQELALNLNMEASIVDGEGGHPWGNQGQMFYPTFGTVAADGTPHNDLGLVAPVAYNSLNDCKISYRSSRGDGGPSATQVATDLFNDAHYQLVALCVSGCYTPDQRLLFKDGYVDIGGAYQEKNMEIMTLAPGSTLDSLSFETTPLQAYTVDIAPSWQDVMDIATLSGKKITVTTNHALIDSEGQMRAAETLKMGESLVQADGTPDPIVQISKRSYFGKVYNVRPKSNGLMKNIVVAEGLLSGSVYYQNEGVKNLNRDLFRLHLPKDLVR